MTTSRQRCTAPWLWLILTLVINVGCQGIYQGSGEIYPPDPCARLELRIDQARQARKQAEQAASRLRDRAAKGTVDKTLEPDIDRLETATREFARRMAAVSDALAHCEPTGQFSAEIQNLQQRSAQMLETVQLIRREGLSTALPLLDRLLQSPSPP